VKNKEARAAVSKRYNSKPEVKARGPEYKRKYRARNHIKCKAQVSARRDKVKVATPKWVDMGAIEEIYRQAIYTGMTVDHIVPIKHPDVCGLHVPWNLQLLSAAENYSKSNLFNGARTRERSQNASKKR
jgi:5-methylcytosine-specific restriction endonuclease McrA